MKPTRRDFLGLLAGAGALAGFAGKKSVRVGLALPAGTSAARGAALAVEEARRTAELLGVAFEPGDSGALARVGLDAPAQTTVPFLVAGPPREAPVRPRVFHVASSPRRRREALAGRKDIRVVDWHPDLFRFGAEQLNQRFTRRFGVPMDEAAWRGWMAVKIAAEAALRGSGDLMSLRFDGHKGEPLAFGEDHFLEQPVYLVGADGRLVE